MKYHFSAIITIFLSIIGFFFVSVAHAQAVDADANSDGTVNDLDYSYWSSNYGTTTTLGKSAGDFNSDSFVDGVDYGIWFGAYGTVIVPSPSPLMSAPPNPSPAGTVYWRGDAETGNLNQWCRWVKQTADRLQVVSTVKDKDANGNEILNSVAQGKYAYRVEIQADDSPEGSERTVLNNGYARDTQTCQFESTGYGGNDRYYGWSVYIPTDYPMNSGADWSLVAQWKGWHTGSPVISLNLVDNKWYLNYRPKGDDEGGPSPYHKWNTPIRRGAWERWVMHVNYSTDPSVGYIELWQNGNLVVPKFFTKTIHFGYETVNGVQVLKPQTNFVEIGIYRAQSIQTNNVLYHDGMTVGSTFDSVKPW